MGLSLAPPEVKLVAGLLCGPDQSLEHIDARLARLFGKTDGRGEPWDFTYTDYYDKEMGRPITRAFLSFETLIGAGDIARIKCMTNDLERELARDGKRSVNIDPGYLSLSKLVLATTKDGTYRVYLDKGIFGQSTLYFEKGTYCPWPWTYPDYRDGRTIAFFNGARKTFQQQVRRPQ